jgi:Fe-Mn family superoxide dismutase
LSLEELVSKLNELPENLKPIVRNHGGGLLNHNIYWETMVGGGRAMSASLQNMLEQSFGSADEFKKQFIASATSLFGSGRTWLEFDV